MEIGFHSRYTGELIMSFGICTLNSHFNKIIAEYLNKGFELSPFTHDGTFSDVDTYMDIKDPKDKNHVYRVWVIKGRTKLYNSPRYAYSDTATIRVKKYVYNKQWQTMWPNDGETISEKVFYVVESGKVYTDSLEEACEIHRKQRERYSRKQIIPFTDEDYRHSLPIDKLPESFIDSIMAKINQVRGFKRASASCIKNVILYKDRIYLRNGYRYDLKAAVYYEFNGKSGRIYLG